MTEINLLEKYTRTKRDVMSRAAEKTEEDRIIARKFEKEFFDGDRKYGYGGFSYNPKYWTEVVRDIIAYYHLTKDSTLLDIGCAKGFMLFDFKQALPELIVKGIDISAYAIEHAKEEIKPFVSVGNAENLHVFKDKEFDLIISINTLHNLPLEKCKLALQQIERIGRHSFITVDAWRTEEEKKRMLSWNLTAKVLMHVDDWKKLFDEIGYKGDYYWFIP